MGKSKKNRTARKIVLSLVCLIVLVLLLNLVIMPLTASVKRASKGDFTGIGGYIKESTVLSAHRAGGGEAPEETLSAFQLCMENTKGYSVDILEFDLHLTKDGVLVLLHDDTVDRTSNAIELFGKKKNYASDYTYAELRELNMGENFQDPNTKEYPYRGLRGSDIPENIRILTLNGILDYVEKQVRPDGTMNYIIEIKNDDELGRKAMDKLYETMVEYDILDRVIVGTFKDKVTKYIDEKYSKEVTRSASIKEVLKFYYSYLYGVKLGETKYKVLQIPYKAAWFNFGTKELIDYAHSYGIACQYWTINKEKQIEELVKNGADAIMTDYPEVAYPIVKG